MHGGVAQMSPTVRRSSHLKVGTPVWYSCTYEEKYLLTTPRYRSSRAGARFSISARTRRDPRLRHATVGSRADYLRSTRHRRLDMVTDHSPTLLI